MFVILTAYICFYSLTRQVSTLRPAAAMTLPVSSLLVSLLLGVASPAPSPGCGQPMLEQHPGRHHRYNVSVADPVVGEVTRSYILHLPAHYDTTNTRPTPLMLDYHGWSGTAHSDMVNMPWRDVADMDPQATRASLYCALTPDCVLARGSST